MTEKLILLIHCPDRGGLVASVTSLIRRYHGNVVDLDQHVDSERHVFFMRVAWTPSPTDPRIHRALRAGVRGGGRHPVRDDLAPRTLEPPRSNGDLRLEGQPLPERLLSRWESGEWRVDIPLIVSNHLDLEPVARRHGIRFEHVPVTAATKAEAERRQIELLREVGASTSWCWRATCRSCRRRSSRRWAAR